MTPQEAIQNIKQLIDGSVKAGLFVNTEGVAVIHESYLVLQKLVKGSDEPVQ